MKIHGWLTFFLRFEKLLRLCFVLSVFPTPLPEWDLNKWGASLCCELGSILSVSLDENVKLYIAEVALIKGEKIFLKSLELVCVSMLPSGLPFGCSSNKKKKLKTHKPTNHSKTQWLLETLFYSGCLRERRFRQFSLFHGFPARSLWSV